MHPNENVRDEAARWAALTRESGFDDWDGFTLWLERSPAHARAYDEVVAAVDAAVESLGGEECRPGPEAANDDAPVAGLRKARWFGPALAASLAGLAAVGLWQFRSGDEIYATPYGETIEIVLDDGSTIELGGGSRLVVEEDGGRRARLERGQALFRIRHDDSDPFLLVAGNDTLVDAGTIFDVRLGKRSLEVGVAEGAVIVNPLTRRLRLDAGERLMRVEGRYDVARVAPAEVGEWADGRVTFRDARLSEIAIELTRTTGVRFVAAPDSQTLRLSGSIALAPVAADPRTLEPLLGITAEESSDGWVLSAE